MGPLRLMLGLTTLLAISLVLLAVTGAGAFGAVAAVLLLAVLAVRFLWPA